MYTPEIIKGPLTVYSLVKGYWNVWVLLSRDAKASEP